MIVKINTNGYIAYAVQAIADKINLSGSCLLDDSETAGMQPQSLLGFYKKENERMAAFMAAFLFLEK